MLKIRLSRVGKKDTPIFRLVVAEKTRAVKRENIEILGLYNPTQKKDKFQVNKDRVLFWIEKGAQPSDTANNLLCDAGVLPKNQKIDNKFAKPQKKKDAKLAGSEKPVEKTETSNEETEIEEPKEEQSPEIVEETESKSEEIAEDNQPEAIKEENQTEKSE